MSVRGREGVLGENSRCWGCPRIFESRIATVTDLDGLIAKYLLHGDHTIRSIRKGHPVAKVAKFHGLGNPYTTLVKGRACAL